MRLPESLLKLNPDRDYKLKESINVRCSVCGKTEVKTCHNIRYWHNWNYRCLKCSAKDNGKKLRRMKIPSQVIKFVNNPDSNGLSLASRVFVTCPSCGTVREILAGSLRWAKTALCRSCSFKSKASTRLPKHLLSINQDKIYSMNDIINVACRSCNKLTRKKVQHIKFHHKWHFRCQECSAKENGERLRARWQDAKFKEKMAAVRRSQSSNGHISSIQKTLYSILDDLHIGYESEKSVGFYNFDCFLPDHNILIECQGDYWHSLPEAVSRDRGKATYIKEYFPHFQLKCIWEHEFSCKDRIRELIKYWCGLNVESLVDYKLQDLQVKTIDVDEAKLFISKYHYSGSIGNSQSKYGAYLGGELIAVCIFGQITRKESASRLGYKPNEVKELTRFCVHPKYHRRNLPTWFISRCIKTLKQEYPKIKCLISFADSTFGHVGIIYKASNWKLDGIVEPSYWYVDKDGYVMHKKTLWNHASKAGMSESEFVSEHGYCRVDGKEKYRYIWKYEAD